VAKAIRVFRLSVAGMFFLLFFLSGVGKLLEPVPAALALVMVFRIPFSVAVTAVFLTSNGEILLAMMLIFKRFRQLALSILIPTVLVMFLTFLLYIYFSGIILEDCGCFGGLWKRTIPEAIVEEIIFLALWIIYFVIRRPQDKLTESYVNK